MPKTILCYGDSNTYGYVPETGLRYPRDVRYPGRLQILLGDEYIVIEEGCNGRTTVQEDPIDSWKNGLPYLRPCLNSHKPVDIVIMMLGSNDLKRRFCASPEDIAGGIREHLDTISDFMMLKQGFRPRVLLISPPLIDEGITQSVFSDNFDADAVDRSMKLAPLYRSLADSFTESGRLQCDFLDAAQLIEPSAIDSLHLMPDAHRTLAEAVASWIAANR